LDLNLDRGEEKKAGLVEVRLVALHEKFVGINDEELLEFVPVHEEGDG
jgi:hypothetical protein